VFFLSHFRMLAYYLFITLILFFSLVDAKAHPKCVKIETCKKGAKDLATGLVFTLSPDPPVAGKPLKISVKGDLKGDVPDDAIIKASIMGVYKQTVKLCDVAKKANVKLPIKSGFSVDTAFTVDVPDMSVPVPVTGEVVLKSGNKKLLCRKVTVQVVSQPGKGFGHKAAELASSLKDKFSGLFSSKKT